MTEGMNEIHPDQISPFAKKIPDASLASTSADVSPSGASPPTSPFRFSVNGLNLDKNFLSRNPSKKPRKTIGPYTLTKTLGSGSMGKVKLAINGETGKKFAVKIIPRKAPVSKGTPKDESRDIRIHREIALMVLLNHPYIVSLHEAMIMPHHYYLFFEYVSGGQILDYIISHGKLKEKNARKFARQMLSAVEYCHRNSIVHRDLKIENILITEEGNIKLIDFGLSNLFSHKSQLSTFCGSLYFAAPELLSAQEYVGPEVDVWSLGIVFYVLVCGRVPFDDPNMPALHAKIKKGDVSYPSFISKECKNLLSRMLVTNPSQRATMAEIMRHPWVNKGYDTPIDTYVPIREPIQLPLDMNVIQRMKGFEFGNEEKIKADLEEIIKNEEFNEIPAQKTKDIRNLPFFGKHKLPANNSVYNHPLVSIYHLVSEKMKREAKNSMAHSQASNSVNTGLTSEEIIAPNSNFNETKAADGSSQLLNQYGNSSGAYKPIKHKDSDSQTQGRKFFEGLKLLNSTKRDFISKGNTHDPDVSVVITSEHEELMADNKSPSNEPKGSPTSSTDGQQNNSKQPNVLKRLSSAMKPMKPSNFHRLSHGPPNSEITEPNSPKPGYGAKFGRRISKLITRHLSMQEPKTRNSLSELDSLVVPQGNNNPSSQRINQQVQTVTSQDSASGFGLVKNSNESSSQLNLKSIKPKSATLKGLFSVATTSTKKVKVITEDIVRVLQKLGVRWKESDGYFECMYSPNSDILNTVDDISQSEGSDEQLMSNCTHNDPSRDNSPPQPQPDSSSIIASPVISKPLSRMTSSSRVKAARDETVAKLVQAETSISRSTYQKSREPNSNVVVKFHINLVKIRVVLRLHGIQFRRVEGPSWEYKNICSKILNELKL